MLRQLAFLLVLILSLSVHAAVRVGAAISLSESLEEIARLYERQAGERVQLNFGASNLIARQIEEGAAMDLFLSADERTMDALEAKALIEKTTRIELLSNHLVLVVPSDSKLQFRKLSDLNSPLVKRIALGDPAAVPAGIYARQWLEKERIWDQLERKIVPCDSVRAALAVVDSGNAEAGIVYRTDLRPSSKVRMIESIPTGNQPRVIYPVAVLKESKSKSEAQKFLEFLKSETSQAVFQKKGFISPVRK